MGQLRQNIEGKTSILLIEDDRDVGESMRSVLSKHFWVELYRTAEEALGVLEEKEYSVILCDLKLPGMSGLELFKVLKERGFSKPFIIITAFGDIPTAVEATKLGVNDFIRKGSVSPDELIQKIYRVCEDTDSDFVCASPIMQNILAVSKQVAKTDSNILIVGESGVGKEVLARYIHKVSPRANKPFVAINMSAIPDNLLESELFGYEKGAFTGAEKRKLGKFEIASGGTLLLDEIGDMPLHLQPKILRVIQERKIERLGYNYPIKVDVRIVSTTNRDLESMVKEGKFREDLYFRLSVMPIKIPPLRERKEDIVPLVEYFVSRLSRKYEIDVSIGKGVIEKLMKYDWPGNVRELQNVIERAFVISFSSNQKKVVIEPNHLIVSPEDIWKIQIENKYTESTDIQEKDSNQKQNTKRDIDRDIDFDDLNIRNMEKAFIIKALERTGGNKTQAAKLLGITVRTLRNKLKELKMANSDSETE